MSWKSRQTDDLASVMFLFVFHVLSVLHFRSLLGFLPLPPPLLLFLLLLFLFLVLFLFHFLRLLLLLPFFLRILPLLIRLPFLVDYSSIGGAPPAAIGPP